MNTASVILVCSSQLDANTVELGKDAVLALEHVDDVQVLSPR